MSTVILCWRLNAAKKAGARELAWHPAAPLPTFQPTELPSAIAVDGKGTIYVNLAKGVTEVLAGQSTPASTLPSHGPISVDAAGNVYIRNVEYAAGSTAPLKTLNFTVYAGLAVIRFFALAPNSRPVWFERCSETFFRGRNSLARAEQGTSRNDLRRRQQRLTPLQMLPSNRRWPNIRSHVNGAIFATRRVARRAGSIRM